MHSNSAVGDCTPLPLYPLPPLPPQVLLSPCQGSSDIGWLHNNQYQLVHHSTGLCLDSEKVREGHSVVADVCDASKASQTWHFSLQLNPS